MAAIQNDRDVLLQAASVRVVVIGNPQLDAVIAATKGVKLSAPSTVFSVPATGAPGVTTPTSIVIEAKLTLITGGVMWDVYAGSATLSASGNTCTLIPSLVTSPSVTVRARVVFEGITYTDYWTVAMVKDGADGAAGAAGEMLGLTVYSNADTFTRSGAGTVPTAISLTAQMLGGLTGTVSWSVVAGSATLSPSGATCSVSGPSVTGYSVTVMAQVVKDGITYQARYTLSKLGTLSAADTVSLTTQVTGQLANGNVSGLGALALLNTVNLNTQTVGALNLATQTSGKIDANTQVTNLGNLAFANAIAANQIGAGQLAAGVIYAGTVNATQVSAGSFSGREFTGGTFTGPQFRTANSGDRVQIDSFGGDAHILGIYKGSNRVVELSGAGVKATITSGSGGGTDQGAGRFYNYAGTGVFGQSLVAGGFSVYGYSAAINGVGVYGSSVQGYGAVFESISGPAVRMIAVTALPTNKTAGGMCYHGTHGLCFSDGTNWIKLAGTVVT